MFGHLGDCQLSGGIRSDGNVASATGQTAQAAARLRSLDVNVAPMRLSSDRQPDSGRSYFVDPAYFDQVRRVTRSRDPEGVPLVTVKQASMPDILKRLDGFVSENSVTRRFQQVCLNNFPRLYLPTQ